MYVVVTSVYSYLMASCPGVGMATIEVEVRCTSECLAVDLWCLLISKAKTSLCWQSSV